MKKGIYITKTESNTGSSVFTLGIMNLLLSKARRVAYFRPIIKNYPKGRKDNHIDTVLSYFKLDMAYKDAYGFTISQVVDYKNAAKESQLIDEIITKYKKLEETYDVVLVEGSDYSGKGVTIEFDLNVEIAKNLALPTILISSAEGKDIDEAVANLDLGVKEFAVEDVTVQAVFMNKVARKDLSLMKKRLRKAIPEETGMGVVPKIKKLGAPTIKEIKEAIGAEVLFGESLMNKQIDDYTVGAMQLPNYLHHFEENNLIITPGDRADIILGTLQANASANYPGISGIVLTGGLVPEPPILKLIEGLSNIVPILLVNDNTYDAANKIDDVEPKTNPNDIRKIKLSIAIFDEYIDANCLINKFKSFDSDVMTPRMFQYNLVAKAKKHKKHIILPEGSDARILTAAVHLVEQNVVDITLLGNKENVLLSAAKIGVKLNGNIKIIDPATSDYYEDFWKTYHQLRKHKNIPEDMAKEAMLDVSFFGTMMVYKGYADGMVSGATHTTAHTIIPALQFIKTRPGIKTVSSIFFMCLDDHVSVFGDCAVNINPNADQLAEIAICSADSAKAFGIEPKIALLSYSSGSSGSGEEVEKVKAAKEKVLALRPDLSIEGPLQYDAAVSPLVAAKKMPDSKVAGTASVLIFPDLNTGNNTYKAVQRETGALAIGPMLQGLKKPVNDLSRGCTIDDIFNTVVITAIQAQENI